MPDVRFEGARGSYDDALEVACADGEDIVGVATFAVDRRFDGTPTGAVDPLPIRVYVYDQDGQMGGKPDTALLAYLTLDEAVELRDLLDAAIEQVRFTRDDRRRHPLAGRRRLAYPSDGQEQGR